MWFSRWLPLGVIMGECSSPLLSKRFPSCFSRPTAQRKRKASKNPSRSLARWTYSWSDTRRRFQRPPTHERWPAFRISKDSGTNQLPPRTFSWWVLTWIRLICHFILSTRQQDTSYLGNACGNNPDPSQAAIAAVAVAGLRQQVCNMVAAAHHHGDTGFVNSLNLLSHCNNLGLPTNGIRLNSPLGSAHDLRINSPGEWTSEEVELHTASIHPPPKF